MEHRWNEIDRGKTCPSATLSTTNPTWTDPAANRLSHGTAYITLFSDSDKSLSARLYNTLITSTTFFITFVTQLLYTAYILRSTTAQYSGI
jgi:hypothetical protein